MALRPLLAAVALMALSAPAAAQQSSSAYEQGRAARLRGDFVTAERLLRSAIAAKSTDYMATYNLGLVYVGRGDAAPPELRTFYYRSAATWLEKAKTLREMQNIDEYSIYNSLGAVYYSLGDLGRAEAAWATGLKYAQKLPERSQAKLYSNLGYLYGIQGKPMKSQQLLSKGAELGSPSAQSNLDKLNTVIAQSPPRPPIATITARPATK